jgi:hypothetical protein
LKFIGFAGAFESMWKAESTAMGLPEALKPEKDVAKGKKRTRLSFSTKVGWNLVLASY